MNSVKWPLLLLFWINFNKVLCYYEYQAKVLANDGHLIFESALDKNITFRMKGNGYLNIDEVNLLKILENVSNVTSIGGSGSGTAVSDLRLIVTSLSSVVRGKNGVLRRLTRLENSTSTDTTGIKMRVRLNTLTRKITVLERRFSKLLIKLKEDNCRSNPCQNGGNCLNMYDGFICQCSKNWEGPTCGLDVNECAHFAGTDLGCQNGATCRNTPGGYSCLCTISFQGIHCTRRSADCLSSPSGELCGHGTCVNTNDGAGYKCICEQGWKTNGLTPACTVDVDECSESKPHCSKDPEVNCINIPGSFLCGACPAGFTGNGYYCNDINECESNNGGCSISPTVTCINIRGSSQCGVCPPGFDGDGRTCTMRGNGCNRPGLCHPSARCVEYPSGTVSCICPAGFYGPGYGIAGCRRMNINIDPCSRQPCLNGGTCNAFGNNFTCSCLPGYSPPYCARRVNRCAENPCLNGGTCLNTILSYTCLCPSNTTGENCQIATRSCGGILENFSGILKYPDDGAEQYNHNSRCAWLIRTNHTKVLNITFTKFHLEVGSECKFDWLQIHDGRSSASYMIGRFCGNQLPKGGNIVSTHNMLYLWFRSDNSTAHLGFELKWESIDPVCGDSIDFTSHGTVNSPGHPGNYPPNRDCKWILTAPPGKRILFHFFTMKLEAHNDCKYDFVSIHGGTTSESTILQKFCNTTQPEPLITPSNEATIYFHSDEDNNDAGFQISYAVVEGVPGCGGTYTSATGELNSPTRYVDGFYPHNLVCEYLIKLPLENRIGIEFTKFHLEESESCKFDFLEVYDGRSTEDPLIGRFCGKSLPSNFVSQSNFLLIKFKSDWSTAHPGFSLVYKLVCGGIFSDETGIVMSPGYPLTYESNRVCEYTIQAPLGKSVALEFSDFDFEGNTNQECEYDYLQIFDGHEANNASSIGKYCGESVPQSAFSTLNFLTLQFSSDTSIGGRGFKANYSFIDISCGGIIKSADTVIRSPADSDGSNYAADSECRWTIVAPKGQAIQLAWTNFDLEKSNGCLYDYVEIYDNSSINNKAVGKFCGTTKPPAMTSAGNIVTIFFKSDSTTAKDGFSLTFSFIDTEKLCGGNFFTTNGVLRSPGWPNEYLPNKNCEWILNVPMGQQIALLVKTFSMEKHTSCRFDGLEIRNGGTATSPLIGKFCGTEILNNTVSFSNKLYLRFYSDSSRGYPGFDIEWDGTATGCGGTLNSPRGSIASPNYPEPYGDNSQCVWRISVSEGSTIHIVFTDLDMENHQTCSFDYLEIFDGRDASGKTLGRFCTSENDPLVIDTTSNHAFIRMRSDATTQGRGFTLKYNIDCKRTIKGHEGVIESPNFPAPYPPSLECEWTLSVTPGNKINLQFSHFKMENGYTTHNETTICHFDYIEIVQQHEEEVTSRMKYCSEPPASNIITSGSQAVVKFHTDASASDTGFRLEWQIEGCGGILTHPDGIFTSPNYPKPYPLNTHCEWTITVDVGYSVELTISEFNMEVSGDCRYDGLLVANGENETQVISHFCHMQTEPSKITSSGHKMFVKFYSDVSQAYKGFSASYKSVRSKCGGLITTHKGYIYSPNYPSNYPSNQTCEWIIKTDPTHTLQLNFMDFDLENSSSCVKDSVRVYDTSEQDEDKLLLKHCGSQLPKVKAVSTGNEMRLVLSSDSNFESKGFKANYTVNCGSKVVTSTVGVISLKDTLQINSENCTWTISAAEPTQHVTLTISQMNIMEIDGSCLANLTIHDGDSIDAPVRVTKCGVKVPPAITSNGNSLTIHIYSEDIILNNLQGMQFFAHYSIFDNACGGSLSSLSGEFASPNYPKTYPMNVECIWNIQASAGNALQLYFKSLSLIESENCNVDYLEIREENDGGKFRGVYCGKDPVLNITSSNSFWIKFKSSNQGTAAGFIAEYSYLHNNELSGKSGKISSPLYPKVYARNAIHSWRVIVALGSVVSMKFKVFEIDGAVDDRCGGQIKIYDGFDETAIALESSLCGMTIPDPIKSSTNVVYIQLDHLDATEPSRFLLEWEQVDKETTVSETIDADGSKCGGHQTITLTENNSTINITSPGYPFGYGSNMNCTWIIKSEMANLHPVLILLNVDLEEIDACLSDFIEISSSSDLLSWTSIGRVCTFDFRKNTLYHGKPYLKINFLTDYSGNRTGFTGQTLLKCGGLLNEPNGVIAVEASTNNSRQPKRMDTNCMWNITVRPGRTIQFEFESLKITKRSDGVCIGYVIIKNGIDDQSPFLGAGKFCGTEIPSITKTSSNRAFVKYMTGNLNRDAFTLKYKEVGLSCGGATILTSAYNETIVTSPNYPNIPHPHSECLWTFMAQSGERIKVEFIERFELTWMNNCLKEYVELRDGGTSGSKLIGKYCHDMPQSQITKSNVLRLKYFTDVSDPKNGFKVRISIAKCGGMFRSDEGTVKSTNYPYLGAYPVKSVCEYYIIGRTNAILNISFTDMHLPQSDNCSSNDNVRLYSIIPGNNETEVEIGFYCGTKIPDTIVTESNQVKIVFQTFEANSVYRGFSLNYQVSTSRCGSEINAESGDITSPGYPANGLLFRRFCEWRITVPKGRRIKVDIIDIDMVSSANNYMQRIGFYNDHTYGNRIKFFAASEKNESIYSSSNKMMVNLWSRHTSKNRGFKIHFSSDEPSACVGNLNELEGSIDSPSNLASYVCEYDRDKIPFNSNSNFGTLAMDFQNVQAGRTISSCAIFQRGIFVKWRGAASDDQAYLKKFCGNNTPTAIVRSPFSDITIIAKQGLFLGTTKFNMTYKVHQCGGLLSIGPNTIIEPNFNNATYGKVDCAWQIKYDAASIVNIEMVNFNLKSDCDKEYVLIYNGGTPLSPMLGRFCGQVQAMEMMSTQRNYLFLEYHSDAYNLESKFEFKISPKAYGCGGTVHKNARTFSSPAENGTYPNNIECIWKIKAEPGYHIGANFAGRFYIEESVNCTKDYLEAFDKIGDDWVSLGRVCGRDKPKPFNSTGSSMKLVFRSDSQVSGDGFNIEWQQNCGGIFYVDDVKKIMTSPNYPQNYDPFLNCNYTFKAPKNEYIRINFKDFVLEDSVTSLCSYDNVTIYKEEDFLTQVHWEKHATYCKRNSPGVLRYKNSIAIVFQTDRWVDRKGFMFEYYLDRCGGTITNSTRISTPENVATEIKTINCEWKITAPANKKIVVRFEKFEIDHSDGCYFDLVEVYKTLDKIPSNRLAQLCGNLTEHAPAIKIDSNQGIIIVKSDQTSISFGVSALVLFVESCDREITLTANSPTYNLSVLDANMNNLLDCQYVAKAPTGFVIILSFVQFHLGSLRNSTDCSTNFLEVRDGAGPFSQIIKKFCGHQLPAELSTSGSNIFMRLVTDSTLTGTGFSATLRTVPSACGPHYYNVTNSNSYEIKMSSNGATKYPSNTKCLWVFETQDHKMIDIDFLVFDLQDYDDDNKKCNDHLEIVDHHLKSIVYEGLGEDVVFRGKSQHALKPTFFQGTRQPNSHHIYCGSSVPTNYYSSSNKVYIQFESDSEVERTGFVIKVQQMNGCNRNYTRLQGRLHVSENKITEDCVMSINVPQNFTIALYFNLFYFPNSCEDGGMKIYDGGINGNLIASHCNYMTPDPVFSTSNSLTVKVLKNTDPSSFLTMFDLTYLATDKGQGCGGQLFNYGGVFSSPLYPNNNRTNIDCYWDITVPNNMVVAIKFKIFDLGGKSTCSTDYVQIRELDDNEVTKVARQYCGEDQPAIFKGNSNFVQVRYKKSVNFAGTGWIISFMGVYKDSTVNDW